MNLELIINVAIVRVHENESNESNNGTRRQPILDQYCIAGVDRVVRLRPI